MWDEVLEKYPLGCTIITPFGKEVKIYNRVVKFSDFLEFGSIVLSGNCVYDAKSKKWAEVI